MPDPILSTAIAATLTLVWSIRFISTHHINSVTPFVAEAVAQVFFGSVVIAIIFWATFILS